MSVLKKLVVAPVAAMMLISPVLAADPVRPAVVQLPAASSHPAPLAIGTRLGNRVGAKNGLLGAPLFLLFLGATAVTVGTILITNGNNTSSPTAG